MAPILRRPRPALCVALGNYHNCGPDNKIAAEYVSFSDVQGLVKLCTQVAASQTKRNFAVKHLRKSLKANAEKYRQMLKPKL